MDHESSLASSTESGLSRLVEKAFQHWEAKRQAAAAHRDLPPPTFHAFTVTLSREAGTEGSAVAEEVGKLLDWPVYDRTLLEKIARDMGLRTRLLASVDERQKSLLANDFESLMLVPVPNDPGSVVSESAFVHHLVKIVLALGVHGDCVIVGRAASFILPATATVRVRLVGSVRERVAALSRNLDISESEAALQVQTTDRQRIDFVQEHFSKDLNDARNYDLILNEPRLSVVPTAELIVETLHRLQARAAREGPGEAVFVNGGVALRQVHAA